MRIAMIVPALLIAASASAQDFSYRYVEVLGSQSKNNDTDITLDTVNATVSLQSDAGALLQFTAGVGEADDIPGAAGGPEGDVRSIEAFVGGARQLSERTSAWTGIGLGQLTIDPDNAASESDVTTARFSLGLRHWLFSRVEAHGAVSVVYFDNDDVGEEVEDGELRLGLRFYPLPQLSLNVEAAYQFDERVEIIATSLRYDF